MFYGVTHTIIILCFQPFVNSEFVKSSPCSDGIHERSFITVCTEKDKTLSEADTDEYKTVGELSRVTDYYGNTLKETDAYGVSKVYTYDGYGTLTGAKLVGSDGSEMTLQSSVQDGNGNITSVHMPASGADITYSEPFGLPSEIYPKSRNSSGKDARSEPCICPDI